MITISFRQREDGVSYLIIQFEKLPGQNLRIVLLEDFRFERLNRLICDLNMVIDSNKFSAYF